MNSLPATNDQPHDEMVLYFLRAVNLGGRNMVPMAELRGLMNSRLGLAGVGSHIASGNLWALNVGDPTGSAAAIRELIRQEFDVDTPVLWRTAGQLQTIATHPFVARADPRLGHVVLSGEPVSAAMTAELERYLNPCESLEATAGELFVDYASGVHGSRLSAAVIRRIIGEQTTARNLRTLLAVSQKVAALK